MCVLPAFLYLYVWFILFLLLFLFLLESFLQIIAICGFKIVNSYQFGPQNKLAKCGNCPSMAHLQLLHIAHLQILAAKWYTPTNKKQHCLDSF